ncbi:hypothetical protein L4C31_00345 [Aliivibrio sifiae]
MTLNKVKTLEDLREYLYKKYKTEWQNLSVNEILKKQSGILSGFELSDEEYNYVATLVATMESHSVKKTIINTSKAKAILVKRKQ